MVLVYNILNNGTAPCLREFFPARSNNDNDYHLRNYDTDLSLPKPKKEFLKRSFRYSGAVLWNSLSTEANCSFDLLFQKTYLNLVYNCYSICNYTLIFSLGLWVN